MTARINPLEPPYDPEVDAQLRSMMPGDLEPIALFRTLAKNLTMTRAMKSWGSYALGRELSIDLRGREIIIDRTCARCGCEYEWGVHVAFYAQRAALSGAQVISLNHGDADDPCWESERDRLLIQSVDALHDQADIGDDMWSRLEGEFDEAQLLDLTMLCGWYHAISFTARAARVALEPGAPTFDLVAAP
jgi:alkylhydroperoxidase family enzyme